MILVRSGFVGHCLLEEFVSEHLTSSAEIDDNVHVTFLQVLKAMGAPALLRKELELGAQFQKLLHKLYEINVSDDPLVEEGNVHDIEAKLTHFWNSNVTVHGNRRSTIKPFHFQGGYWNREAETGHAIGWYFAPEQIILTNSGEGMLWHKMLLSETTLGAYYEVVVEQKIAKGTEEKFFLIVTKALVALHRASSSSIKQVYDVQVPALFKEATGDKLRAGTALFLSSVDRYDSLNTYLNDGTEPPPFHDAKDVVWTRPRFMVRDGRFFAMPQLSGSCQFWCTAWFVQARMAQIETVQSVDGFWRKFKGHLLLLLEEPAEESDDPLSVHDFDISRTLVRRYRTFPDEKWQMQRAIWEKQLMDYPLMYELEESNPPEVKYKFSGKVNQQKGRRRQDHLPMINQQLQTLQGEWKKAPNDLFGTTSMVWLENILSLTLKALNLLLAALELQQGEWTLAWGFQFSTTTHLILDHLARVHSWVLPKVVSEVFEKGRKEKKPPLVKAKWLENTQACIWTLAACNLKILYLRKLTHTELWTHASLVQARRDQSTARSSVIHSWEPHDFLIIGLDTAILLNMACGDAGIPELPLPGQRTLTLENFLFFVYGNRSWSKRILLYMDPHALLDRIQRYLGYMLFIVNTKHDVLETITKFPKLAKDFFLRSPRQILWKFHQSKTLLPPFTSENVQEFKLTLTSTTVGDFILLVTSAMSFMSFLHESVTRWDHAVVILRFVFPETLQSEGAILAASTGITKSNYAVWQAPQLGPWLKEMRVDQKTKLSFSSVGSSAWGNWKALSLSVIEPSQLFRDTDFHLVNQFNFETNIDIDLSSEEPHISYEQPERATTTFLSVPFSEKNQQMENQYIFDVLQPFFRPEVLNIDHLHGMAFVMIALMSFELNVQEQFDVAWKPLLVARAHVLSLDTGSRESVQLRGWILIVSDMVQFLYDHSQEALQRLWTFFNHNPFFATLGQGLWYQESDLLMNGSLSTIPFIWRQDVLEEAVPLADLLSVDTSTQWSVVLGLYLRRILWLHFQIHPEDSEAAREFKEYKWKLGNRRVEPSELSVLEPPGLEKTIWWTDAPDLTFGATKKFTILAALTEKRKLILTQQATGYKLSEEEPGTSPVRHIAEAKGVLGHWMGILKDLELMYRVRDDTQKITLDLFDEKRDVWASISTAKASNSKWFYDWQVTQGSQVYWIPKRSPTHIRPWAQFHDKLFSLILYQRGTFYLLVYHPRRILTSLSQQLWDYEKENFGAQGFTVPSSNLIVPIHFSGLTIEGTNEDQLRVWLLAIVYNQAWIVEKLAPHLLPCLWEYKEGERDFIQSPQKLLETAINLLVQPNTMRGSWWGTPYRDWLAFQNFSLRDNRLPFLDIVRVGRQSLRLNDRKYAYPLELQGLFWHSSQVLIKRDRIAFPWSSGSLKQVHALLHKWFERKQDRKLPPEASENVQAWAEQNQICATKPQMLRVKDVASDLTLLQEVVFQEWMQQAKAKNHSFLLDVVGPYNLFRVDESFGSRQVELLLTHLVGKGMAALLDYVFRFQEGEPQRDIPCELVVKFFQNVDPLLVNFSLLAQKQSREQWSLQWMGALLIRRQQQEIINGILDDQTALPQIRQAVMGIGKSSVLIPALLLDSLYTAQDLHLFVLQPSHLVSAAHHRFQQVIAPLVGWYTNLEREVESRSFIETVAEWYFSDKFQKKHRPWIWITSDSALKSLYLHSRISKFGEMEWENPRFMQSTVMIMDEIDSMYNPAKSDFNIPRGRPVSHLLGDWVLEKDCLIQETKSNGFQVRSSDSRLGDLRSSDCPLQRHERVRSFVSHHLFMVSNGTTLELLSSSSSSSQEGKFVNPEGMERKEADFVPYYHRLMYTLASQSFEKKRSLTGEEIHHWMQAEEGVRLYFSRVRYQVFREKLLRTIELAATLVPQLNYGLKPGFPLAVPYVAANIPSSQSFFEDIDLAAILTVFLYLRKGRLDTQDEKLLKEYRDQSRNYLEVHAHETYAVSIQSFLIDFAFPAHLKMFKKRFNLSFMDLMDDNLAHKRIAFSGTVNMLVPEGLEWNLEVKVDPVTEGAIEAAISGISTQDQNQKIQRFPAQEGWIDHVFAFCQHHSLDVLLDCAAVFKDFPMTENDVPSVVVRWWEWMEREQKTSRLKGIVYWGSDDVAYCYTETTPKQQVVSVDLETSVPGEYFYYFAQPRTIGTDIPQPIHLRGLVFVASYLTKSAVAQAMYRLRFLHRGQTVRFACLQTQLDTKVQTRQDLWNDVKLKEETNRGALIEKHTIQNLFLLRKKTEQYDPSTYVFPTYYAPVHGSFQEYLERTALFKGALGLQLELLQRLQQKRGTPTVTLDEQEQEQEQEGLEQADISQRGLHCDISFKNIDSWVVGEIPILRDPDTIFLSSFVQQGLSQLLKPRPYHLLARVEAPHRRTWNSSVDYLYGLGFSFQNQWRWQLITADEVAAWQALSLKELPPDLQLAIVRLNQEHDIIWLHPPHSQKEIQVNAFPLFSAVRFLSRIPLSFQDEMIILQAWSLQPLMFQSIQQNLKQVHECITLALKNPGSKVIETFIQFGSIDFLKSIFSSPETFFSEFTWLPRPVTVQIDLAQKLVIQFFPQLDPVGEKLVTIHYPKKWFQLSATDIPKSVTRTLQFVLTGSPLDDQIPAEAEGLYLFQIKQKAKTKTKSRKQKRTMRSNDGYIVEEKGNVFKWEPASEKQASMGRIPSLFQFVQQERFPFNENGTTADEIHRQYQNLLPYCGRCQTTLDSFIAFQRTNQLLVNIYGHWFSNVEFGVDAIPCDIKDLTELNPAVKRCLVACLILEKDYEKALFFSEDEHEHEPPTLEKILALTQHETCLSTLFEWSWFQEREDQVQKLKPRNPDTSLIDWENKIPAHRWRTWLKTLEGTPRSAARYPSSLSKAEVDDVAQLRNVTTKTLEYFGTWMNSKPFDLFDVFFVPSGGPIPGGIARDKFQILTVIPDEALLLFTPTQIVIANFGKSSASAEEKGSRAFAFRQRLERKHLIGRTQKLEGVFLNIETLVTVPYYLLLLGTNWNIDIGKKMEQFGLQDENVLKGMYWNIFHTF